jgi:hypothetical protein
MVHIIGSPCFQPLHILDIGYHEPLLVQTLWKSDRGRWTTRVVSGSCGGGTKSLERSNKRII